MQIVNNLLSLIKIEKLGNKKRNFLLESNTLIKSILLIRYIHTKEEKKKKRKHGELILLARRRKEEKKNKIKRKEINATIVYFSYL